MRTHSKTCVAPAFACLEFIFQSILKSLKIKLELTLNSSGNILIISRVSNIFHPLCIWVAQLPIMVMISNLISKHFGSNYKTDNSNLPSDFFEQEADTVLLSSIQTTYGEIVSDLQKLKSKNTFGTYKIPSKILKECMSVIVDPRCLIFNESLSSGSIQKIWKTSYITFVSRLFVNTLFYLYHSLIHCHHSLFIVLNFSINFFKQTDR